MPETIPVVKKRSFRQSLLDTSGDTELHTAVRNNDLDSFRYLLTAHSETRQQYNEAGFAPFHLIAAEGKIEFAQVFIKSAHSKSEVFHHDTLGGIDFLEIATFQSQSAFIEWVLSEYIDNLRNFICCSETIMGKNKHSPLHIAVREGHQETFEALSDFRY